MCHQIDNKKCSFSNITPPTKKSPIHLCLQPCNFQRHWLISPVIEKSFIIV